MITRLLACIFSLLAMAALNAQTPQGKKESVRGDKNPLISKFYVLEQEIGVDEESRSLCRDDDFVKWIITKIPQVAKSGRWQKNNGFVEQLPIRGSTIILVYQTPSGHAEIQSFFATLKGSMQTLKNERERPPSDLKIVPLHNWKRQY